MKKTLFLLMPLLVLSSCGANTQAKEEKQLQFKETTENVDEIFGEIEWTHGLHNRLAADAGTPIIGIQERTYTVDTTEYYAIRFVAALKGEPTSAVWTRTIFDANKEHKDAGTYGSQLNEANQTSHIYYDKLNNGASSITPEDEEVGGAGYTKFAIYTMYNIPIADAENYYIQAYVTVDGATSKVGVGNIRNKFSFDVGTTGYFLAVNKNGKTPSRVITPNAYKHDDGNAADFWADLKAGDKFIPVHITDKHLWTYGMDKYGSKNGIQEVEKSDMAQVVDTSKFCIYLNGSDELYVNQADCYYLDPKDWDTAGAWFAMYAFGASGNTWKKMVLSNNGLYYAYVDKGNTSTNFVRMKNTATKCSFDEKWDQTGDITLTGHENQKFVIKGWSYGDWEDLPQ